MSGIIQAMGDWMLWSRVAVWALSLSACAAPSASSPDTGDNGGSNDGGKGSDGGSGTDGGTSNPPIDSGSGSPPSPIASSCAGLPATCGAQENDNCCHTLPVPGGNYY